MSKTRYRVGNRKRKELIVHASIRARQRYGIDLSEAELTAVAKMIRGGEAEFLDRQSLRVSRHKVKLKGVEMIAVYDKLRRTVVTFLTLEMVGLGPAPEVPNA